MLAILIPILGAGLVAATLYSRWRMRIRTVEDTLRGLGASPVRSGLAVMGRVGESLVRYTLTASSETSAPKTLCQVSLPPDLPGFEMDLRPQTALELRSVRQGRAIDLVFGDEAFDDAFIVEAAPSSIAREVLDHSVRTHLLTFAPCHLRLENGNVHFEKFGLLDEPAEIRRVIEIGTAIAARLHALRGELRERRLAAAHLDEDVGYRGPAPGALAVIDPGSQDSAELVLLQRVRAMRRVRNQWTAGVLVALTVIALAVTRACG